MGATIEHTGVITSLAGKSAFVRIDQFSACSECHARQACTASDKTEKIIEAKIMDGTDFTVGENVMVIGHKSIGIQAIFIAYILPFALIIAALFTASFFTDNELIAGSAGLAVLVPYLIVIRLMRHKLQSRFQFYISKI